MALRLRRLLDVVVEHGGVCCGLRIVIEGMQRGQRGEYGGRTTGMTGYAEG